MDFDKYKNNMVPAVKPPKPILLRNCTSQMASDYALQLKIYEEEYSAYKTRRDEYRKKDAELCMEFKTDALEDVGLANHPKSNAAFAYAWDRGHSSGYSDVYSELCEIADLLLGGE